MRRAAGRRGHARRVLSSRASARVETVRVVLCESGEARDTARMLELLSLQTGVSAMRVIERIDLLRGVYDGGRTSFHSVSATMGGTLICVVM